MRVSFFLYFVFLVMIASSQDFEIPNYQTKEDYINEKDKVIEVCDWLISNPIDAQNRKAANAYLIKWTEGSPMVSVGLTEYVLKLTDKNPDFLILFIAGWVKHNLVNGKATDLESNYNATLVLVGYYISNDGVIKDPDIDRLIKLKDKGKLKDWVGKQI